MSSSGLRPPHPIPPCEGEETSPLCLGGQAQLTCNPFSPVEGEEEQLGKEALRKGAEGGFRGRVQVMEGEAGRQAQVGVWGAALLCHHQHPPPDRIIELVAKDGSCRSSSAGRRIPPVQPDKA